MTEEIKQAVEAVSKVNEAFEAFKSTHTENLKNRDVVLDEKLARIEKSLDEQQKLVDEAHLAAKRAERVRADAKLADDAEEKALSALKWAKRNAKARGTDVTEFGLKELSDYKRAFDAFLRKDERQLTDVEVKALSVGSDPDGGYVVHPDMSGRITRRIFETSNVRAFASVQTISTDALEGIVDNDEAAASWVGETASRTETDTPQLGKWRIPVHEMYANPYATQRLLDDAEINMEGWLADKVADKFARTEADAFVTGNGVGKPRGFLTYSDYAVAGTFEDGKIEQFDTGANGAFTSAGLGANVLYNAIYGLKAQYRQNATWFMNRTTTGLVRKLQDTNGQYIWQPSLAAGQPATLAGYGVASFEDMPDPDTGSLSIAFGDLRTAYQIVERAGVRVLRDPYSAKPYVTFYTTKRVGGDVVNFEAIKLINFKS